MAKDKIAKAFLAITKDKFTIDTIAEMIATKHLAEGDIVRLNGYYSAGDGAGHKRKIEATDDGSGVQLANGLWANIVHNGEVNVSWFGGSQTKLFSSLKRINRLKIDKDVEFTHNFIMSENLEIYGSYKIVLSNSSYIVINNNTKINVDIHVDNTEKIRHIYPICSMEGVSVTIPNVEKKNISIKSKITGYCEMAIYLHNSDTFDIDVEIEYATYSGVHLIGCRNGNIKFILHDLGLKNQTSELSYGITASLSKYADVYKVTGRTTNVTVRNSIVHNGDNWNAFDTHGGKGITFVNCKSFGVGYPMGIVDVPIDDGTLVYPEDIIVDNCYLESIKDMEYLEQKVYGVALKGDNVRFTNNTIKYGGNQKIKHDSIGSFGLRLSNLTNSLVADNTIIECSNNGIGVLSNVSKTKIYGNTVIDPYSENINPVSGVFFNGVSADDYSLEVYDNTVIRTTKQFPINMTRVFYNNSYKVNSFYNNKLINLSSENLSLKWEAGEGELGRDKIVNKLNVPTQWQSVPSYFGLVEVDKDNTSFNNQLNNNFSRLWYVLNQTTEALDKANIIRTASAPNLISVLDTPYHATNMKKLGILDAYHNYLTELYQYEKSQNVPEGVMNLNVLEPPVIPKEIEEYAKEYNLL